jgi:uncharacterized protein (TIGR03435 family)
MRILAVAALVVGFSLVGLAQQPRNAASLLRQTASPAPAAAQSLKFEAASIRLSAGPPTVSAGFQPGGRYTVTARISQLLLTAYPAANRQLVGAPGWVTQDWYDVAATAGREATRAEMQEMIRTLLIERFNLLAHEEVRDLPVFNLVLAREDGRLGPDMARSTLDCAEAEEQRRAGARPVASNGAPACGSGNTVSLADATPGGPQVRVISTVASGATIESLAGSLAGRAGRTIIDRTGLTGRFDYRLRYAFDTQQAGGDAPAIFTAVQEQLGLRLQPATAPLPVLIIDRIERPTEN